MISQYSESVLRHLVLVIGWLGCCIPIQPSNVCFNLPSDNVIVFQFNYLEELDNDKIKKTLNN